MTEVDVEAMLARAVELRRWAYRFTKPERSASDTGKFHGFMEAIRMITGRDHQDLHDEVDRRYAEAKRQGAWN